MPGASWVPLIWLIASLTASGVLIGKGLAVRQKAQHLRSKTIEDMKTGDWVLAKDQNDPSSAVVARRIEQVFRRTTFRSRSLRIRANDGSTQTLTTTDEHPFWCVDTGRWTKATDLKPGQNVSRLNGVLATLVATAPEEHPEGVPVFNLRVENSHTYFVSAENSVTSPVWVHNAGSTYRAGDLPAKRPPNSSAARDDGAGNGQIRDYGPDGRAVKDYDFGHNHPPTYPGDPHVHDWDWTQTPPRQPPRPLGPGD